MEFDRYSKPNDVIKRSESMHRTWLFLIGVSSICMGSSLSEFAQSTLLLPPPPSVNSEAYVLIDAKTGTVLAEKNADKHMAPASLTKLMTSYVIFHALEQGHLHLDDDIHISTKAWNTEGSRLFLNENGSANLQTLLKGTIITSGNDASVALSEHFAGSEENFSVTMNRYAERLNMQDSHFVTATGLDHEEHYSSCHDIAKLSSHIINDFPQYFHWFHEQSISHNGITQPNRNTLLNTHPEVDGLKTGYTSKAGYCLATTAQKNNTRLIVVTLNAPSKKQRDQDTMALLNYGFRFYESALLYTDHTSITAQPVYLGMMNKVNIQNQEAFWATIPKGAKDHLIIDIDIPTPLHAPINTQEAIGTISARIDDEVVASSPLYAEQDIQSSKGISFMFGYVKYLFAKWF